MDDTEKQHAKDALRAKPGPYGSFIIDRRKVPFGECDICDAEGTELRPYGPQGEWICFTCGMVDEKTTGDKFLALVFNE